MTHAPDDFDALFEEVSAQRSAAAPPADVPAVDAANATLASAPPPTDDPSPDSASARGAPTAELPMFERLGSIVRLLHDSLRQLGYDQALAEASSQITDAQDRLAYVANLTEQAANKVLNTLDAGMPAQAELGTQANLMERRWQDLFEGKLSIDEFKILAGDSRQFAQTVANATEAEKARLLDIMMAQDFQDITGQLIKKVVGITKMVEGELAQLLRDHAPAGSLENAERRAPKQELLEGPSTPSKALDQHNVDDLLADLGF